MRDAWQLLRCDETRRAVRRLAIVFALLWPVVLLGVDHHGGERIPTHEHIEPLGEPVAAHVHAFALPHVHGAAADGGAQAAATTLAAPLRIVVRIADVDAPPLAVLATSLLGSSTLPLVALMTALAVLFRAPVPRRRTRLAQTALIPPTPPPLALVSR